jgi:hypothetical protein
MKHPEIIAVPLLMLLDYALTILGASAARGVYRCHFRSPHYEINPLWQPSVRRLRWVNPRHLLLAALITGLLLYADFTDLYAGPVFDAILGALLGSYGCVYGRHLTNLLLFRYLNRHPGEISGEVNLSHRLVLRMSAFNLIGLIPLLVIVAVRVPDPFVVGVLLGVAAVSAAHVAWGRRAHPPPPDWENPSSRPQAEPTGAANPAAG